MTTRTLGIYLCVLAATQCGLYSFQAFGDPNKYDYLFYLNPRFGLGFLEEFIIAGGFPNVLCWGSSAVILSIGFALLRRPMLDLYLIAESIMGVPSIIAFVFIIAINMKATDGFSIGELPIPVLVFILFSGPPFAWALLLKKKVKNENCRLTSGSRRS